MISVKKPTGKIKAELELPGSKSISNRLLLIREINKLTVHFKNLSEAEDTVLLARALGECRNKKSGVIDVHHAGTDMRFLTAYLSTKPGDWTLTGSGRMKERPVGELVNTLRKLGADITYTEKEGFPPLRIKGKHLVGGKIKMDAGISSQFISALLLIASQLQDDLEIELTGEIVSRPYLTMTIELLQSFGALIETQGNTIIYRRSQPAGRTGGLRTPSSELKVESDWSAASYWYSIVALSQDAEISLNHLSAHSLQADSILPQIYAQLGVKTTFTEKGIKLSKEKTSITEFSYDFIDCPDIAQTLAVTCFGLGIKANLKGLQTLRHKETDRISALKTELGKFGAVVEATHDTLIIQKQLPTPNSEPRTPNLPAGQAGSQLQTYDDHRMAMSFAPLTLICNEITFDDEEVVNKSYPGFWDDLGEAGFELF